MNELPKDILDKMEEKASVWNDEIRPYVLKGILIGYQMATKAHISTPPTTEEAELWNEVVAKIATADICKNVKPADNVQALIDWKLRIIEKLRPDYELRRRSDHNSEAIEFMEWAIDSYEQSDDVWYHNTDHELKKPKKSAELYQEFQLFKQKQ